MRFKQMRIIRDRYNGYEAQSRYLWWPIWGMWMGINTKTTAEEAEQWARNRESPLALFLKFIKKRAVVVKILEEKPDD